MVTVRPGVGMHADSGGAGSMEKSEAASEEPAGGMSGAQTCRIGGSANVYERALENFVHGRPALAPTQRQDQLIPNTNSMANMCGLHSTLLGYILDTTIEL